MKGHFEGMERLYSPFVFYVQIKLKVEDGIFCDAAYVCMIQRAGKINTAGSCGQKSGAAKEQPYQ